MKLPTHPDAIIIENKPCLLNQGLFLLWLSKDCEVSKGIQCLKPELESNVKYLKSQEDETKLMEA